MDSTKPTCVINVFSKTMTSKITRLLSFTLLMYRKSMLKIEELQSLVITAILKESQFVMHVLSTSKISLCKPVNLLISLVRFLRQSLMKFLIQRIQILLSMQSHEPMKENSCREILSNKLTDFEHSFKRKRNVFQAWFLLISFLNIKIS